MRILAHGVQDQVGRIRVKLIDNRGICEVRTYIRNPQEGSWSGELDLEVSSIFERTSLGRASRKRRKIGKEWRSSDGMYVCCKPSKG